MTRSFQNIHEDHAWVFHREDIQTTADGLCHAYILIDAQSGLIFGAKITLDLPAEGDLIDLMRSAQVKSGRWPRKILINKRDPIVAMLGKICAEQSLLFQALPTKDLKALIDPVVKSFRAFKHGLKTPEEDPLSPDEVEELDVYVPKPFEPCPCGSKESFKSCCQKAFNDICLAMCAAEEGNLKEALSHMQAAEAKIGRTAETVCRTAICWSFFDEKKSRQILSEALTINPNHPRANYIRGINAVQDGQFEQAIGAYQRAIANCPVEDKFHLNEYHNNLGTAFYHLGDYKRAKEAWEKGLLYLPSDSTTRENLHECIYSNPNVPEEIRAISPFVKKFL